MVSGAMRTGEVYSRTDIKVVRLSLNLCFRMGPQKYPSSQHTLRVQILLNPSPRTVSRLALGQEVGSSQLISP